MVGPAQLGLSIVTVALSGVLGGLVSWKVANGGRASTHDRERYDDAEAWCDDFIRVTRELQANYTYKNKIMQSESWDHCGWMPGKDLDEYGTGLMEHLADRPAVISDVLAEREGADIADTVGEIASYCGMLSNEGLRRWGRDAPERMEEHSEQVDSACEALIGELWAIRREELQEQSGSSDA